MKKDYTYLSVHNWFILRDVIAMNSVFKVKQRVLFINFGKQFKKVAYCSKHIFNWKGVHSGKIPVAYLSRRRSKRQHYWWRVVVDIEGSSREDNTDMECGWFRRWYNRFYGTGTFKKLKKAISKMMSELQCN